MNSSNAGNRASARPNTPSNQSISPAARKLAEYIARRWAPMIKSVSKHTKETQQANDAVAAHMQTKGR
jgi:hypothetical protein